MKYVNIHLKGRSKAGLLMMLVIRIKANFPFKNKGGIVKNRIDAWTHAKVTIFYLLC